MLQPNRELCTQLPKYVFYSYNYGRFTKIKHTLDHNINHNTFQKIGIL